MSLKQEKIAGLDGKTYTIRYDRTRDSNYKYRTRVQVQVGGTWYELAKVWLTVRAPLEEIRAEIAKAVKAMEPTPLPKKGSHVAEWTIGEPVVKPMNIIDLPPGVTYAIAQLPDLVRSHLDSMLADVVEETGNLNFKTGYAVACAEIRRLMGTLEAFTEDANGEKETPATPAPAAAG